ncbi:MAG: bifunctional folylpolyglutamate synthase/dihydrofolate synthase [Eubacterium sp.]|nr:bifunctional folylpolyglutamate synthase/dihydrofolate synthase [Eubacterium sp.]
MDYKEAREYLESTNKYGSVLGLDTIKELLKRLDDPQDKLNVVHFAGTNGKGSTMAYLESILLCAGYSVGKYSSPAVFEDREIITVDRTPISEKDVAYYIEKIKKCCDDMIADGLSHPTRFEIETAMAFSFFADLELDVCLIECGMGGRDDATNVFEKILLAVITSISLDHTKELGNTIEEIKENKEGIIKAGCPVVYAGTLGSIDDINQETAIRAAEELQKQGFKLKKFIDEGIEDTYWPGRMETICENPLFIIDGAHNPGAILKLRDYIDLHFTNKKITFIMGVLADKDYSEEASIIGNKATKIYTITPNNNRGLEAHSLATTLREHNSDVTEADSITEAVEGAYRTVKEGQSDMIIAFGSLSILRDIKEAANKLLNS